MLWQRLRFFCHNKLKEFYTVWLQQPLHNAAVAAAQNDSIFWNPFCAADFLVAGLKSWCHARSVPIICTEYACNCHSMTDMNECSCPCRLNSVTHGYFYWPCNSNRNQCESTNQAWEWWPNVWMSTVLNAGYYYTSSLCMFIASG